MSITSTLFPPANREAALVAFLRTFWQVLRPPIVLGSLSLGTLATTGVFHTNLKVLGIIAAATVLSAIMSGALAAGDILKNGLPDAYTNAVAATSSSNVTNFYNPIVPAPVDPSQPAAGTPPSFDDIVTPTASPSPAPAVIAAPVVTPVPAAPFVATSDALPPATA